MLSSRAFIDGGPQSIASTPAQTSVSTTAGVVLLANGRRKGIVVQNTGTTIIKLTLGGTPTQTVYHIALKACDAADDGTGGTYFDTAWLGEVSAISSGLGGTCVITETRTGNVDWNLAGDGGNYGS